MNTSCSAKISAGINISIILLTRFFFSFVSGTRSAQNIREAVATPVWRKVLCTL